MAIRPEDEYTNTNPADASYPQGSAKNSTTLTSKDGTPLEKKWVNDLWGFLQKLLNAGAVTPSGAPDTVLASDYYNAVFKQFSENLHFTDSGIANAYVINKTSGGTVSSYFNGQVVFFKPSNSNTGASTIRIGALGIVDLRTADGSILSGGQVDAANFTIAVYNGSSNRFEIVSFDPTAALTDSDLRVFWF